MTNNWNRNTGIDISRSAPRSRTLKPARVLLWTGLVLLISHVTQASAGNSPSGSKKLKFSQEFVITKNAGYKTHICFDYVRNLNQFRRLSFDDCAPRLSKKYPRFKKAHWKPYPFDLTLAKRMIIGPERADLTVAALKEHASTWGKWLAVTSDLRAKGKVKMWYANVDMLGYHKLETVVKMNYVRLDPRKPLPGSYCGKFYDALVMLGSSETANRFNLGATIYTSDLLYDEVRKIYYTTLWQHDALDPVGYRIGATGGVTISLYASNPAGQSPFGLADICHIVWVPKREHQAAPAH